MAGQGSSWSDARRAEGVLAKPTDTAFQKALLEAASAPPTDVKREFEHTPIGHLMLSSTYSVEEVEQLVVRFARSKDRSIADYSERNLLLALRQTHPQDAIRLATALISDEQIGLDARVVSANIVGGAPPASLELLLRVLEKRPDHWYGVVESIAANAPQGDPGIRRALQALGTRRDRLSKIELSSNETERRDAEKETALLDSECEELRRLSGAKRVFLPRA